MARQTLALEMDPGDLARLRRLIKNVEQGVSDMGPFFDACEMHMIDSLTQNFESGGRPQKWSPLSPVTILLKGSSAVLQDTGALKNSVNSSNTEKTALSLKIFAGESHGTFHQFADQDPGGQFGMKNKRGTPMRPFMMFQDEDVREIEQILGKYIDDILGGP